MGTSGLWAAQSSCWAVLRVPPPGSPPDTHAAVEQVGFWFFVLIPRVLGHSCCRLNADVSPNLPNITFCLFMLFQEEAMAPIAPFIPTWTSVHLKAPRAWHWARSWGKKKGAYHPLAMPLGHTEMVRNLAFWGNEAGPQDALRVYSDSLFPWSPSCHPCPPTLPPFPSSKGRAYQVPLPKVHGCPCPSLCS